MNLITRELKAILSRYDLTLLHLSHGRASWRLVRCAHLGGAGKQAPSLRGVACLKPVPSAFLVQVFLKQQGGTAESVDSTFFGNSQTQQ